MKDAILKINSTTVDSDAAELAIKAWAKVRKKLSQQVHLSEVSEQTTGSSGIGDGEV